MIYTRHHILKMLMLLMVVCIVLSCNNNDNSSRAHKMPIMRNTYSITDKNPGGLYVAHRLFKMSFPDYTISKNQKPFNEYFKDYTKYDYSRSKSVYTIISQQFLPTEADVEAMTDFASQGNTLFIASNIFEELFLAKFKLQEVRGTAAYFTSMGFLPQLEKTGLKTTDTLSVTNPYYSYFYYPLDAIIQRKKGFQSKEIVLTDKNQPSAIVIKYGSGRIIVVNNVASLTNYFLLTHQNYQYLQHLLSYIPKDISDITWDTYYNKTDGNFSSFQELMKHPTLRWAFWLSLVGALLLILMSLVRRQRPIDELPPNTNSSVEFAETVARLYLQKNDTTNIGNKMIAHFLEQVRSKYYIGTSTLNHEFAQLLTAKSGVSIDKTMQLLQSIEQIQKSTNISDYQLLHLNTQIQEVLQQILKPLSIKPATLNNHKS